MSILIIPWIVLVVSALMAMHLRLGRDLAVPVFLMPWTTLGVHVGVSLSQSQIILILLTLKYALNGKLNFGAIPSFGLILGVVFCGLAAATITFMTHVNVNEFAGGELRNGPFRTVVVLVVFILAMVPFALVNAKGVQFSVMGLLKVYVVSVLILCLLGVVQFLMFIGTGTDPFPIWMFNPNKEKHVTAIITGYGIMRPCSLAGEPKGFAIVTAAALALIMTFGSQLFRKKWSYYGSFLLCLLVLFLTNSTSAFLSFGISVIVLFGLRFMGRPLQRPIVMISYFIGATVIVAIYFTNVANIHLVKDRSLRVKAETTLELIYMRSLGRMNVEDMDWVIIRSFQDDILGLPLGRGFGLGHLFTDHYIPIENAYMIGTLVSPKSGVILFIVNSGILGFALFLVFLSRITPAPNYKVMTDPIFQDYVKRAQVAFITITIMFLLRTYLYEIALMLFAIMSAGLRPKPRGNQQFRYKPQPYMPNRKMPENKTFRS